VDLHGGAVPNSGARALFHDDRLETGGKSWKQVLGEPHRTSVALAQLGEMLGRRVPDDEKVSSRSYGVTEPTGDVDHAAVRWMKEVRADEVVRATAGVERASVDLPPIGVFGDTGSPRMFGCSRKALGGEVGAGGLPSSVSEPDDVASLAAAHV